MYATLLSEQIRLFFVNDFHGGTNNNAENCFGSDSSINFIEIRKLLPIKVITTTEYSEFLKCYKNLLPFLERSVSVLRLTKIDDLQLKWMGKNAQDLKKCSGFYRTDSTLIVEQTLVLTSVMEKALGDIYSTLSHKSPPHLLRDLLATKELARIFGVQAMLFLRVLMGAPNGINLRNIVWHGFPMTYEIPRYYQSALLLTAHTFGIMLGRLKFTIRVRPLLDTTYIDSALQCLEIRPMEDPHGLIELMAKLVFNCEWLSSDHKIYWKQIIDYYLKHSYWKMVMLMLPQIELLLRLIYSKANDFDTTAKLDEYYITMDTIFQTKLPVSVSPRNEKCDSETMKENQLLCKNNAFINDSTMHFMYDLFIANKLRLRDKISHGEMDFSAFNNRSLCEILMVLSCTLLLVDTKSKPLGLTIKKYESKFHLNRTTKQILKSAKRLFENLKEMKLIDPLKEEYTLSTTALSKVKIFKRPPQEAACMKIMNRISNTVYRIIYTYTALIPDGISKMAARTLHSRRRKTLKMILAAMPEISKVLANILQCLEKLFNKFQQTVETDTEFNIGDEIFIYLKHTQSISTNLEKYANKESNEWIKCLELCSRYQKVYQQYFIWK